MCTVPVCVERWSLYNGAGAMLTAHILRASMWTLQFRVCLCVHMYSLVPRPTHVQVYYFYYIYTMHNSDYVISLSWSLSEPCSRSSKLKCGTYMVEASTEDSITLAVD